MKKVLSVVLAVMMLFSVMAVNTSAANDDYADIRGEGDFVVVLYLDNCTMDAGRLTGRYRKPLSGVMKKKINSMGANSNIPIPSVLIQENLRKTFVHRGEKSRRITG